MVMIKIAVIVVYAAAFFVIGGADAADYKTIACPFVAPANVVCGEVLITPHRALPVVRLGGGSGRIPAVVLGGGGPGAGLFLHEAQGVAFWDKFRRDILGDAGELLLIDQSGAGDSKPLLSCPDIAVKALLARPLSLAEDFNFIVVQHERCLMSWNKVLDLDSFNTAAAADDMEKARLALGIDRWDVIGFSYGSRLALELIRRHPQGVRAGLLDSVLPADADRLLSPLDAVDAVIGRIAKACGRDSYCARYGDLRANINAALALVETSSSRLTVRNPHSGGAIVLALTPSRLADIFLFGLYSNEGVAQFPKLARQLADGNVDTINMRFFVEQAFYQVFDKKFATALNIAYGCGEWNSPEPPTGGDRLAVIQKKNDRLWRQFCRRHWPVPPPQKPVQSDKPLMLIAGEYDHATPLAWAKKAARRLPAAQLFIVPMAHTPLLYSPCLKKKARQFFMTPDKPVQSDCPVRPLTFY